MSEVRRIVYHGANIDRPVEPAASQAAAVAYMKNQYQELSSNGVFTLEGDTLVCRVADGSKA